MGKLPVAPKYAKMILMASRENCLQYVIAIVAALTVKVCGLIYFTFLLSTQSVYCLRGRPYIAYLQIST